MKHQEVIKDFLRFLNNKTDDYVLKGGTALRTCYYSKRNSEDIDLDSLNKETIKQIVKEFCEKNNYSYTIKKDTDTVKRFMINYGDEKNKLKVEVSYRNNLISKELTEKINGINVYNIDMLCNFKTNAYRDRDKLRDMYDLSFICINHYDELSPISKANVEDALYRKGFEQYDYLIRNIEEKDEPIKDATLDMFLDAMDKMNIEKSEEVKEKIAKLDENKNKTEEHKI